MIKYLITFTQFRPLERDKVHFKYKTIDARNLRAVRKIIKQKRILKNWQIYEIRRKK